VCKAVHIVSDTLSQGEMIAGGKGRLNKEWRPEAQRSSANDFGKRRLVAVGIGDGE
jgi:hypothetical protein